MKWQRILAYLISGGLFLTLFTPLIISSSLFFPYITGKAFFFRIIVEIIFALWLLLVWHEPTYRPKRSWIMWSVVALMVVSTLATILGANPYRSFWSNFERMGGLVSYLHLLAYFLVISSVFHIKRIWHWFFRTSVAVSMLVAGYGLTQLGTARLDATLGNATYLAVYMLFHIFLTLVLMRIDWKLVWPRYLYSVVALVQLLILYRTATRGAILGLLAGVGVMALCLLIKRWREPRVRKLGLGLLFALVLLVVGFWSVRDAAFIKNSSVLSRFANISLQDGTTESRLTIWQMSLRGFAERPLLGWGPENFELVFSKHFEPKLWRQEPWFDRSHNIFLDWLIDAGALGLIAYLSLFISALYYLWRSREQDLLIKSLFTGLLAAYTVNNIFVFDNLVSYLLFFSLLAYFHRQALSEGETRNVLTRAGTSLTPTFWTISATLAIALGVVVYCVNIKPLIVANRIVQALSPMSPNVLPDTVVSERLDKFRQIFDAQTFGSRESSEQLANQATQIITSPAVSDDLKQEVVSLAIAELEREVSIAPESARTRLILGVTYLGLGRISEALETLTIARELAPRKQATIFQSASAHLASGDQVTALALAKEAFELDENYPEARKFYAIVLIRNGDLSTAGEILSADPSLELDDRFINAYVEAKRYDLVLKLWQERVNQDPGNTQFRFSLAAAYLMTNQRDLAIRELETAAEIDARLVPQTTQLIREIRAGRNPTSR